MKVHPVNLLNYRNNINNIASQKSYTAPVKHNSSPDIFVKTASSPVAQNNLNPLSFMGYSVHILDGGEHRKNMNYFANSISDKWDLYNKEVETNYRDNNVKQLESLEWKLKELNFEHNLSYDKYHNAAYVAIPVFANVPLQNLEAQMNAVTGSNTHLTPQNIRTKKDEVLNFLKLIYENPNEYRQYINYMDPQGQGIEKTYGIIYQINQIAKKPDTKVYIPASEPEFASIKWLTEQRGLSPELTNYIATRKDTDNIISNIKNEIKDNGWYDFNLLALSDAQVVNLKDVNGEDDYIYSAYDASIKDGARGVYNFSPVRDENGEIKGYSFHNETRVDYPFEEFPGNKDIEIVAKFAGQNAQDVIADSETTQSFKNAVWNNQNTEAFADKLFSVEDIYPQSERDIEKMSLKGDYIDSTLQHFFRVNDEGKIIHPASDCEGSGRPGVWTMWGSCFSMFNAIKNDIELKERFNERGYFDEEKLKTKFPEEITKLLNESEVLIKNNKIDLAKNVLIYAIELEKTAGLHGFRPLEALGDLYNQQGDLKNAEKYYNSALNELARQVLAKLDNNGNPYSLSDCRDFKQEFEQLQEENLYYINNKNEYDNQNFLTKMFLQEPKKPQNPEHLRKFVDIYNTTLEAERLFRKLAENCEQRNEDYPAFACNWAADMMVNPDRTTQEILERRADNNYDLGDFLHVD